MAVIDNFEDQVTDLVGKLPTAVTDKGEKFFNDGILDTIERFAKVNPSMLSLFGASTSFNPETGYTLNSIKVLGVTLDNGTIDYVCTMVPSRLKNKVLVGSGSIYEATRTSPVYWIDVDKLYAAPYADFDVTIGAGVEAISTSFYGESGKMLLANGGITPSIGDIFEVQGNGDFSGGELEDAKRSAPTKDDLFVVTNNVEGSEAVAYIDENKVTEVVQGVVTNYLTGSASSIANFPGHYYYLPILYTAIMLVKVKILGFTENTAIATSFTSLNASIAKLAAIITSTTTSVAAGDTLLDAVSWTDFGTAIGDVSSMITEATIGWNAWVTDEDSEMANTKLGGMQSRIAEAQMQVAKIAESIKQGTGYGTLVQGFGIAADAVLKEMSGYVQYIQQKIAEIASNVGVNYGILNSLTRQYESAFLPLINPEPEEEKDNGGT